jgi:hypothetical protein
MTFCQPEGVGQFLYRGELTGIHTSPPSPCPADGAQHSAEIGLSRR